MTVDSTQVPRQTAATAFMTDGKPLQLGETGEVPDPHAADGFAVLVADQMGGGKIIAVEFLLERAALLAHVDRAANGDDARHLVHRANHFHGDRVPGHVLHRRQVAGAIEHLQVGGIETIIMSTGREAERLQHAQTFLGHRA